ncbi:acyl CoA:acetate/3-ketoacid CoA transferase [Aliamphritea spongicola]|uniref:acyl CoA:acetate/3-ketoacid CoA transferase n=1 Tax=Aliamphritea spongicola TaxID=707589 RepID=UPI00196A92E6|nr:malonate decarboxylase subunit alpha [Aliamphritea spongicola]MBN3562986.1 malonate decarboxylase subunit alpha [Aliamphritea spongicola]
MQKNKVITVEQAASLIQSNDTVVTGGFVGIGFAEAIAREVEKRFLREGQPKNLTLFYSAGQGDGKDRGLNHFGHKGMVSRVIGGHWGLVPGLGKLAIDNEIEAYNLPQGVICHMFRDMAAGKPGTLSRVGLKTFVDPRLEGAKVNSCCTEDMVQLLTINEEEALFYKHFPLNVALLRGTTADRHGNISMEHEALHLDSLAIAQAVKNNGGIVLVQVERLTDRHVQTPDRIRIPGILVDHVIVSAQEDHYQTFHEMYNPAYTGEIFGAQSRGLIPLDARKVIARRAIMELKKGAVVNLGIGMPEAMSAVAYEEGKLDDVTLTVEPGGIGGQPASGLSFGAVSNADAIIDQPAQFDFYDGGGLDQAFLGLAETCQEGHVNVSRFGSKLAGAGGFINITQNTRDIYFLGTFTSGVQEILISDDGLKILKNGPVKKFRKAVQQITFNGEYATECNQRVTFITERAVFRLSEQGLLLTEIAPGVDLQQDILDQMEFTPLIDDDLSVMDERLFYNRKMRLDERGSRPIQKMRHLLKEALQENASLADCAAG